MQKRLLYIITFFMMTTLQAQLPEGSYHLIACGMVGENYNTLKVQQGRVRVPLLIAVMERLSFRRTIKFF